MGKENIGTFSAKNGKMEILSVKAFCTEKKLRKNHFIIYRVFVNL